jgi:large conductance mechanosensitive channel
MSFDPIKRLPPLTALPTKQMFSFFDEFRTFAFKGNMIDLAIAVVIGGAFGKVVDSLVKNIVMQLVTAILNLFGKGAKSFSDLHFDLNGASIQYGAFLAELMNFMIVAFSVFLVMVKVLGWLANLRMRATGEAAEAAAAAPEPPPTKDQQLLTEIRDLLRNQQAKPA